MRVRIDHLSENGKGVATIDEDGYKRSVFVEGAVPGDILEIEIISSRKIYYEAVIKEIITPSSNRVDPVCPHFGVCGACDLLHVDYRFQLLEKEKLFLHHLKKAGLEASVKVIPSNENLHYRHRLRVQLKEGKAGFFAKKTTVVIPVKRCYIIRDELNKVFSEGFFSKDIMDGEKRYSYDPFSGKILSEDDKELPSYSIDDMRLYFSPKGFVQNNILVNEKLVEVVVDNVIGKNVLDLYSGNGNFSIPVSRKLGKYGKVVAVEGSRLGYELLKKNIIENGIFNLQPVMQDAKDFSAEGFDTVILDPPRDLDVDLSKIDSKRIIYVSCSPRNMVRDVKKHSGYKIREAYILDMFPQTMHFEAVIVLDKESSEMPQKRQKMTDGV